VSKGGRKGRISNELVGASCAAILTVYAAGYLRTRDEARRLGSEAQARRPERPAHKVASLPLSVPVVRPMDEPQPEAPIYPSASANEVPTPDSTSTSTPSPPPSMAPALAKTHAAPESANPAVIVLAPIAVEQASEPAPVADVAETSGIPPLPVWRDGYYTGWGQSRHGDIEAWVTIRQGRIIDAGILNCDTRYPCSVIDDIIHQPVDLQSPDVDKVSRATVSANAYYWGLVEALKKAEIMPTVPAASP